MIPSLLLGHDHSTAELYAITTAPQDAGARRRYHRWVEHRLHRTAATVASTPTAPPAVATTSEPAPTRARRRFRSAAAARA